MSSEDEVIQISGSLDSVLSSPSSVRMPMNLHVTKEWLHAKRLNVRSWIIFLNVNWFQPPTTTAQLGQRVLKNLDHFQSNYLSVFVALMIYCIITSPLLLIVIAASLGGMYIISLRNQEHPLKLFGYEIAEAHQYCAVMLLSIPMFILAGAGGIFFWVLGVTFFLIMMHASFFAIENLPPAEEKIAFETV